MSSKAFGYLKLPYRYVSLYKDGKWDDGMLSKNETIALNESACVFQYAQTCFEGLKAYKLKNGEIVCFRPDENASRMKNSCERLVMPVISKEKFLDAVEKTIKANKDYIPSYEEESSLYLRPFMIGTSPVIGVKPSIDYEFRIFGSPVGAYFSGNGSAIKLTVSDFDRAAPRGTGNVKVGLNYAMSLYSINVAHERGFDENLYLDSATRTYIEETGGANILFISKDGKLIVPKSNSILPSITKKSFVEIAKNILQIEVEERKVAIDEIGEFIECGLCGTAALITQVGEIHYGEKIFKFEERFKEKERILTKLKMCYINILKGEIESPKGWIFKVCVE